MPKRQRLSLREFAQQAREEQFRNDFERKYGQSIEEKYPNVPFSMVYDLHAKEFSDPFAPHAYRRWAAGGIMGQTLTVKPAPATDDDSVPGEDGV